MSDERWEMLLKRAALALPVVQALIVYYGVTTDHAAGLWISFVTVVLTGVALGADPRTNVSRETSSDTDLIEVNEEALKAFQVRTYSDTDSREHWSLEAIPAPCAVMHGSAEPHVLGCEGWPERGV